MKLFYFIVAVFSLAYLHFVTAEMFTALAEMEELLDTETVLVANLEAYISAHEEKLKFLKRLLIHLYNTFILVF